MQSTENNLIISKLNQIETNYKKKIQPTDNELKPIMLKLALYNQLGVSNFIGDKFIVELFNKIKEVNDTSLNDSFINKLLPEITKAQIDFIFKNPQTSYKYFLELQDKKIQLEGLDGKCPEKFKDFIDNFLFAPCLFVNLFDKNKGKKDEWDLANKELELSSMIGNSSYINLIKNLYITAQEIGEEKFERVIFMASILFNTKSADLYYDLMTEQERIDFNGIKNRVSLVENFDGPYSDKVIGFLDKLARRLSTSFQTSGDVSNISISNLELGLSENSAGYVSGTVDAAWPVLHEEDGKIVCTPILCHFTSSTDMAAQNFQFFLSKEAVIQNKNQFDSHLIKNYFANSPQYSDIKINNAKSILLKNKTVKNKTKNLTTSSTQDFNALYNVELLACLYNSGVISRSGKTIKNQTKALLENIQDIRVLTKESLAHISQISFKNTFNNSDYFTYMASHLIHSITHNNSSVRENKDSQNVKNAATFIDLVGKLCITKENGKSKIDDNFNEAMLYLIQNFEKTIELFKPALQFDGLKRFIAKSIEYVDVKNGNKQLSMSSNFKKFAKDIDHYDLQEELLEKPEVLEKLIKALNIGEKINLRKFEEFDNKFNNKNNSYEDIISHSNEFNDPSLPLAKMQNINLYVSKIVINDGGRSISKENIKHYKDIQNIIEKVLIQKLNPLEILNSKKELIQIIEEQEFYTFKSPTLYKWKSNEQTRHKYDSYVNLMTEVSYFLTSGNKEADFSPSELKTIKALHTKMIKVNPDYEEVHKSNSSNNLYYSRQEIENLYKEKLKLHLEMKEQSKILTSVLTDFDKRLNENDDSFRKNGYVTGIESNPKYKSIHAFIKLGNILTSKRNGSFNSISSTPEGIREINKLVSEVFNGEDKKKIKL